MTTQEIINDMRSYTITSMRAAADRLEELRFLLERKEAHSKDWEDQARKARKERDEARIANVNPEPSRLEIAAMLLAALAGRESGSWESKLEVIWAIEQADALIAAAKEAK